MSLGYGSTCKDVDMLVSFIHDTYVNQVPIHLRLHTPSLPLSLATDNTNGDAYGYGYGYGVEDLYYQKEVYCFPWPYKQPSPSPSHTPSPPITLHSVIIYPIKSCAGLRVSMWPVTVYGLLFDRVLSIVRTPSHTHTYAHAPSYTILTQKTCPRLALLQCRIYYSHGDGYDENDGDEHGNGYGYGYGDNDTGQWILQLFCPSYRNGSVLEVVLHEGSKLHSHTHTHAHTHNSIKVRVCGRCTDTSHVSTPNTSSTDVLTGWLTEFIHEGLPANKRTYTYTLLRTTSADDTSGG
ncbi:hypothetical protein EON63_02780, partial [archaeon]